MVNLKYIMYDSGEFVVFTKNTMHCDVTILGRNPVSAGFLVGLPDVGFKCTGDSETLGLRCRDEDTEIINTALNNTEW
jgi:hypothetical protein